MFNMADILAHALFLNIGVPLLTVMFGIFLRATTRNDRHESFVREDFAFGFEVSLTAIMLFIVGAANKARALSVAPAGPQKAELEESLIEAPWLLLGFVILVIIISTTILTISSSKNNNISEEFPLGKTITGKDGKILQYGREFGE